MADHVVTSIFALIITITFILLSIVQPSCGAKVEIHQDNKKCTPRDTRKVYPRCFMYSVDNSLWCDQSNYTRIPDPNKILKYRSCSDALALYINDSCLEEIKTEDLAKYPNITSFKCGSNKITSLPDRLFAGNKRLQQIDFCTNKIRQIGQYAFEDLDQLKILNLSNNDISAIPMFRGIPALTEISFHNNEIQVLNWGAFRALKNLKILRLSGNSIQHVADGAFFGLESLTHLHLDDNELKGLQPELFVHLTNLEVLTASYNKISVFPEFSLGALSQIHTINFGFNQIREFKSTHIANMSKLQNLSLPNNSLTALSVDLFANTTQLRYLNVGENYLEEIDRHTFSHLCHLETLVLRGNDLKTPYPEWFENIIKNGIVEGTDITDNEWRCECNAMEYAGFLEKVEENPLTQAWLEALQIKCDSPKQYEDQPLDEHIKSSVIDRLKCPDIPGYKAPVPACGSDSTFVRKTEVHTYKPTTLEPETELDTTKENPTSIAGVIKDFGSTKEVSPHFEAIDNRLDTPLIVVILLIVLVIVALITVTKFYKRCIDRKGEKYEKDVESGVGDEKPSGRGKTRHGTETELLHDSRSDCSITANDAYDHLLRDNVTKQRHETNVTPRHDALPPVGTIDSGFGGYDQDHGEYTSMRPISPRDHSTSRSDGMLQDNAMSRSSAIPGGATASNGNRKDVKYTTVIAATDLEGDFDGNTSAETPLLDDIRSTLEDRQNEETRPKERLGAIGSNDQRRIDPDGRSMTGECNHSVTVVKQLAGTATG